MEGKTIQLRLSIVRTRPNLKQVRIRHAHVVEHGGARTGELLAEAFPVVIELHAQRRRRAEERTNLALLLLDRAGEQLVGVEMPGVAPHRNARRRA